MKKHMLFNVGHIHAAKISAVTAVTWQLHTSYCLSSFIKATMKTHGY